MSWQRTHEWGALTRAEIGQARDAGAFVVLPTGSVEQHGDHLPVDTDLVSVERVALAAAQLCLDAFALVLPALPFGVAPEHAAWAGTITLSVETFQATVGAVAASVRRTGFNRLLVVNGHGGNEAALAGWCAGASDDELRVGVVNYWMPGQEAWSRVNPGRKRTMGHACAYETSLQFAMRPRERALIGARIAELPARLARPGGSVIDFPAGDPGYYGDPAAATAESGEVMFETTASGLAAFLAAFAG